MHHFFDWTFHWLIGHPYQTGFYILTILVSVFSSDIRTFLSIPPQKLNIWILKTRWKSAHKTLLHLNLYHADTYQLFLYVSQQFAIIFGLTFCVLCFAGMGSLANFSAHLPPPQPPRSAMRAHLLVFMYSFILVNIRLLSLVLFLQKLANYDQYVGILNRRMEHLKAHFNRVGVVLVDSPEE